MEENAKENKSENTGVQYEEGSKLRPCRHCGIMIPKKAKICPNCKLPQKRKFGWILVMLLLIVIIAAWVFGMVYLLNPDDMSAQFAHLFNKESVTVGTTVQTELSPEVSEEAAETAAEETAVREIEVPTETESLLSFPITGEELLTKTDGEEDVAKTDVKEDSAETNIGEKDSTESAAGKDTLREAIEESGALLKQEETKEDASESESDKETQTDTEGMADEETGEASENAEMTKLVNTEDYTEEEFRELCTRIGYKKLLREKEQYLGAAIMLEVTVVSQVEGGLFDSDIYYLCKETDEQGIERYYILRDDRMKEESGDTKETVSETEAMLILEGDRLLIYGQLFDSCKLPAYLMASRPVVPAVSMVYLDIEE